LNFDEDDGIESSTNLVEADLGGFLAEATTADHHVVLADDTLDGIALAAERTKKKNQRLKSEREQRNPGKNKKISEQQHRENYKKETAKVGNQSD
jgi:hypothetical protein